MSAVWIVARKELRASFQSPVALIFLGLFLIATLYGFFGYSAFFARRLADVRPLFQWLPITLILLVAAVTMRQWAEEKKMGTVEILLTLPVETRDLVLGKFVAGVALVATALAMTLPIPLLVSWMGPLDWGPVIGGYVGALLLGATYVAMGLSVSSRTDNQVVALMLTIVIAGALYLVGSERVTALFGAEASDWLRAIGTGSRFESIERGVLDLRDLAYYGALGGFFLCLNWLFLELERLDPGSEDGRTRRLALLVTFGLVASNALLFCVWLTPVTRARIDMTAGGEYSIADVTVETLEGLAEPLRIDGFFSERTHPLLAPLVPQIRDLLREYEIYGGDRVQVQVRDPNRDEALESELNEQYQIRSVPFRVADRHQQAVVNSYFHILVRYGDQHTSISFDELIDVFAEDDGIQVRLRNLEYDITRTIKRISQDFESMASIFALLPDGVKVTLYATPSTLPEGFGELPSRIRAVVGELADSSNGKVVFEELDPSGQAELQNRLADQYDIRPLAVDLFGRSTFYLDLLLEGGGKVERLLPRTDLSEADLRVALEAAIRRMTPGQLKTVGLVTEIPHGPPPNPNIPPQYQPPPPPPDYRILEQILAEDYTVERMQLSDGHVPDVVDVLLVAKPGNLTLHQEFAIDQYLMRGGKLVVLTSERAIRADRGGLVASAAASPLHAMLESWGVSVRKGLVMDPQNATFPIPVTEQRGGFRFQRIRLIPYPFFADIRRDGFGDAELAFVGIPNLTMPWASALELTSPESSSPEADEEQSEDAGEGEGDVASEILLSTSSGSWLNETGSIDPNFTLFPDNGFAPSGDQASRVVAVSLSGRFKSTFADRPSPLFEGSEAEDEQAEADRTGRTMKRSLADARLIVLGAPEMVSDLMMQLAEQPGGEVHRNNLQLIQNLVDWSVEDTDLLQIRSSGAFARTLRPMSESDTRTLELAIYVVTALLVLAVTLLPRRAGRRAVPIAIPSPTSGGVGS